MEGIVLSMTMLFELLLSILLVMCLLEWYPAGRMAASMSKTTVRQR